MSFIEAGGFSSPICKHFIDLEEIRESNWWQCPCGNWFNYGLLVDLESAKTRLGVATDDVDYINSEIARVSRVGEEAGVKRFIKSVVQAFRSGDDTTPSKTPSVRTIAPAVANSSYSVIPVTVPGAPETVNGLPVQSATFSPSATAALPFVPAAPKTQAPKVPERPRGLASSENRRQIGLFITAVTMVMVAFISYIGWGASLPTPIAPEVQVPIASVVVIGLGFVAVRARRLSRVLSNVLAVTSSVLALVSLWALAYYNVWGAKSEWVGSDWGRHPYVALIPFILGILTLVPGYRFKVAGWLNPTAALFAASGVIFNLSYQQNVLVGSSSSLSLGWQLLTPSITAVLVVVAGRLSRSKLADLPDEAGVAKLVGAPESDRRAYYELVERHREQNMLNRFNRSSLLGLLVVMAVHVLANLVGLAAGQRLDGAGLLVLGFVWLGITLGVETIGGGFTTSGSVAGSIRRGSWIFALGGLGLGVATVTLNSSATFDPANLVVSGILWLVGAALVFLPNTLSAARDNKHFAFAANLTAFTVWASWFVYGLANNVFSTASAFAASAVYALAIAAALILQNFIYKTAHLQIAAVLASAFGALLSLGGSRVATDGTATITSAAVALLVALAILNAFTVITAFINQRAEMAESLIVRGISITANIAAVAIAAPAVISTLYDADHNLIDATAFWPILAVLVLFAGGLLVIPNLAFATKPDSILTARGRQTLIGTSVLYLGAGFIYLLTLANSPHIFVTVTGYTFAVMLVVLSYGYIRRAVWAITASYGLSTIFSIGLGEAVMVYQNDGHSGNTITWAVWFLIPFAALTYLHLLVMRLRAEASVAFKIGLGVGGFAITASVFEFTRLYNRQLTPPDTSPSALSDYLLNRDVNVATLLGLGALVLLLRLSPAVRKDVARDWVLNLSGLLALAMALLDSITTVSDVSNVWAHYIALAVIGILLLINSRTSFAVPQVIASFFAGQFLLMPAVTGAVYALDLGSLLKDGNNTNHYLNQDLFLVAPYVAFLLTLIWFGATLKLAPFGSISYRLKSITLGVSGFIAALSVMAYEFPLALVTGSSMPGMVRGYTVIWSSVILSSSTLAIIFIWRWLSRKSELQLGVMISTLIVWSASALQTLSGYHNFSTWALVFVVPAALLLIDSLVTRKAVSTIVGLTPLLVSSWYFAATLIVDGGSPYGLWHLVLPAAAFGLATLVMRSIGALREAPLWFAVTAPIVLISALAEFSTATSGLAHNALDWPITLSLSLAMLVMSQRIGAKIPVTANASLLSSSGILWLTGFSLIWLTGDHTDILGGQNIDSLIYLAVSTVVVFWHSLAAKSRVTLALGAVGSVLTGIAADTVVHDNWNWFDGPEVGSLVAALGLTFVAYAYGKVVGPAKSTLFTWGIPAITLLWPSVFFTYFSLQIAQPWNELDVAGVTRLIGLASVGTVTMLVGMRIGNRGLVYASVSTLLLEFVPALWNGIGNTFSDYGQSFVNELRGLLVAVTIYVVFAILTRAAKLKINSLIIWGIPALVSLAPTLVDVWGALGHKVDTSDWVRFVVLIGVSTGFMVIGAIRKMSGLFYPGFFGVITAILPYAFSPSAGGGLWIVGALVVLAALIIWVAVRIDRFTGWLKELN
jgi:hypothetical protein